MADPDTADPIPVAPKKRRRSLPKWGAVVAAGLLLAYLTVAYLVIPAREARYVRRHPAIDETPGITTTHDGHPGDPINVMLIGKEADLERIMREAGWHPADPITLRSSLEIAEGTMLRRPYDDAPVSSLYLWGRKQDLAFEQPVGHDPRKRHHVRFWRSAEVDDDGLPAWAGAATFDLSVGFSHATGQITHHIDPDVDAERDHLFETLGATDDLAEVESIPGFHEVREGRNGGGDPWRTDGDLSVGYIRAAGAPVAD